MKERFFIDAGPIAEERTSGIGNTVLNIVRFLSNDTDINSQYNIYLICAFNKAHLLSRWNFPSNVKVKKIYIPGKIMNGFIRIGWMPYMDIFLGKGIYLFPNFKNWPLLRSKSFTYIHDVAFRQSPEHIEPRNLDMLKRNIERWIKRTEGIVTVSRHAKSEIIRYFPSARHKITVVYNGIDTTDFYPRPITHKERVARKYGLEIGNYFMFLSNIEPRKNVAKLLEAFENFCLLSPGVNPQLLLVGGMGWGNDEIIEKMEELRRNGYRIVRPTSYVPDEDIASLLSGSIGLVHPALYEGFGLSPLQAMACGKFVVVARNSSIPEIVDKDEIFVDEGSSESIMQGIKLLYSKRKKTNKKGIERAAQFTWHISLQPLKELLVDHSLNRDDTGV